MKFRVFYRLEDESIFKSRKQDVKAFSKSDAESQVKYCWAKAGRKIHVISVVQIEGKHG